MKRTAIFLAVGAALILAGCDAQTASTAEPATVAATTLDSVPAAVNSVVTDDWLQWRGPNGNGIAPEPVPPTSWSETENVIWKTDIPGRGHSSPTVVGDRIYLATADEKQQVQSVLAIDRQSGKRLWQTPVSQGSFLPEIHNKNTHATGTVASDGERLFVAFASQKGIQLSALGPDGKIQWQKIVGPFRQQKYKFGYAPSPTVYKSLVIAAADSDTGGYLIALEGASGKQRWLRQRPPRSSYSSPIVGNVAGRDQLLISGCDTVAAYNPDDGQPLWSSDATTMATCGTMVWEGDLVFASGGYPKAQTVCVRGDGSGQIVWSNGTKCYEQSMLVANGFVYAVNDGGIALCWQARDGREMWKSRLPGGSVSASPILAGGNVYLSNERGTTYVFRASPDGFQQVAVNQLGDSAFATPTICGGRIYIRVGTSNRGGRQEVLFCIGKAS